MKKLLLLLSFVAAAPAFAGTAVSKKVTPSKLGNGFVYDSLTKVGDKYIITWPRVRVGNDLAFININASGLRWASEGDAVCKAYGYRSGKSSTELVGASNFVTLDVEGSVQSFESKSDSYLAVFSVTCSDTPSENEPQNY